MKTIKELFLEAKTGIKSKTKTFSTIDLDSDGEIKKNRALTGVKPKEKSKATELPTASSKTTKSRMRNVSIDPSKMPEMDFSKVDVGDMKDLDPDDDVTPVHHGVEHIPVKPENLPAIISSALTVSERGVAVINTDNIEWHMVKNLPGYLKAVIRKVGGDIFGAFTRTPLDKIQVLAHVGGGPNSATELKVMANFITKMGHHRSDLEIEFHEVFKNYHVKAKMYDHLGFTFLVMRDFAGEYIYAWPTRDTKKGSQADADNVTPAVPGQRTAGLLPRK